MKKLIPPHPPLAKGGWGDLPSALHLITPNGIITPSQVQVELSPHGND
jgi:hypothetical protein